MTYGHIFHSKLDLSFAGQRLGQQIESRSIKSAELLLGERIAESACVNLPQSLGSHLTLSLTKFLS